jgi:hypothetical protein
VGERRTNNQETSATSSSSFKLREHGRSNEKINTNNKIKKQSKKALKK